MSATIASENARRFWEFLKHQLALFEKARAVAMTDESGRLTATLPLLYGIKDSANSVVLLAAHGAVRDCFVLARGITETAINASFILAGGPAVAERARRHAVQKSLRDLNREFRFGDQVIVLEWLGDDGPRTPELDAMLAEFTTTKGREVRNWTPASLAERLAVVGTRFGDRVSGALAFSTFGVYRHASEIVHGTVFGSLFALGMTSPAGPPVSFDDMSTRAMDFLCMICMLVGICLSAVIQVLAEFVPAAQIRDEAGVAIKALRSDPWFGTSPSAPTHI